MSQTLPKSVPVKPNVEKAGDFVELLMTCLCASAPPLYEQYFYSKPQGGKTTTIYPTQGRGGGEGRRIAQVRWLRGGTAREEGGEGGGGVEPPVGGGTPSRDLAGSCLPSLSDSAASYTVVPDLLFILPADKGCAGHMEVEACWGWGWPMGTWQVRTMEQPVEQEQKIKGLSGRIRMVALLDSI